MYNFPGQKSHYPIWLILEFKRVEHGQRRTQRQESLRICDRSTVIVLLLHVYEGYIHADSFKL